MAKYGPIHVNTDDSSNAGSVDDWSFAKELVHL
jgi:hypothetical protein